MNDVNPSRDDPRPSAAPLGRLAVLEERLEACTAELEKANAARRELEQRLVSSEERLHRQLADMQADYDQAPVGLCALDTELRFQRINASLAGLNGRPAADHRGRTVREMVPGLADQVEPLLRQVLRTGTPALNVATIGDVANPAGGQRVWRAHFHPRRDLAGAIVGLSVMVEEVTALEQAEGELRASEQRYRELSTDLERQVAARTAEIRAADTALRESEARYRTIVDNVVDAIFILDLDGNILAVNAHACQRYGYTREEFLRLHITAIDTPEDAVNVPARIAAVHRDGEVAFEAHHRDARGRILAVEVRASRMIFDGRPAMLGVVRDVTERQRAAQALARSHAALEQAQALTHLGSCHLDFARQRVEWSQETYRIHGMEPDTPIDFQTHLPFIHPDDFATYETAWQATLNGAPYDITHRIIVQGEVKWVHARAEIQCDDTGRPQSAVGTLQDVTARQEAELALIEKREALQRAEQQLRALLDTLPVGVAALDLETLRIIYANECACQMLGRERAEVLALSPPDFFPAEHQAANSALFAKALRGETAWEPRLPMQRRDGTVFLAEVRNILAELDGRRCMLSVMTDITERQKAQERIEYLAFHDELTGLPNRVLGRYRLQQALATARRHQQGLAVVYLDLDRFKYINDTHGHAAGDQLLRELARRMEGLLRAEDSLCRLAADELMLVLPGLPPGATAAAGAPGGARRLARRAPPGESAGRPIPAAGAPVCERLLASLAPPFEIAGRQIHASCSIGVAVYPEDCADGEELMRYADTALFEAKRAGRQTYRFFEARMNEALNRFIQTRDALRLALERQELVLHYQPRVVLDTGQVVGVEALVRWQRPGEGLVMPGDFIDVAEESGLIVPLGTWVLREACRQAAAWRAAGWPDLVVAVNLSAVQFSRGGIEDEVLAALEASGLPPAGLELELTESILLQDAEAVLATVSVWKAAGIQLAIDDFGTGYSSLAYLKRFPVDKLKIDRSFILGMAEHEEDRAIVQAILDLASGLKLGTVAEGVEEASLASQLRAMGCAEAQGYLYARPLAAEDLERWWRARGES